MPTILLLDVSLSMCRLAKNPTSMDTSSSNESIEFKQLANVGIGVLLDYFAQNAQLEYTALLVFSSLWEIRHQFTRHHESIKNGIYDLELYDKSNIVNAVRGVLSLKLRECAQNDSINIVLITDGQLNHESMSDGAREFDESAKDRADDFHDIPLSDLEGQFNFPCKMQIVCLCPPQDPALKYSIPFYKKLITIVDSSTEDCPVVTGTNTKDLKQSSVWLPQSDGMDVTIKNVEALFLRLAEVHYKPYHATLSCGHLSSTVLLSPRPTDCLLGPLKNEFDDLKTEQSLKDEAKETYVSAINRSRMFKLVEEMSICGFMPISEVASPAVTSRHLVLPIVTNKFNEISKAEQILSRDPNAYNRSLQICSIDGIMNMESNKIKQIQSPGATNKTQTSDTSAHEQDITKQPSFCFLLHTCLKQENMVAVCMVGKCDDTNEDWYGLLHSHTDGRKRASLMLSLLIPGPAPILWLPNFRSMGSALLNADLPPAIRDKITNNRGPVKSYSSNNVIWLDPESVQADVQKIVRHAKRSPDKAPHFYKELNRIRRAAISYGFYDVLFGLAAILEREKRICKSANQETLNNIDHVVANLRSSLNDDSYDTNIMPNS